MNSTNPNENKNILSKHPIKNFVLGIIVILIFLIGHNLFAQVGVGTTNPQAALDIEASNSATPTSSDGILIPRMSSMPPAPGAARDGMLVFYTGSGLSGKGFYHWDQSISNWVFLSGAKKINELTDGKSDDDGSQNGSSIFLGFNAGLNDNSSDNKNIGIGYLASNSNVTGEENTAIGYRAYESNTASQNTAIGYFALRGVNNSNSSYNTAIGHTAMGGFFDNSQAAEGNVAIGASALERNARGDNNVAIGRNAMLNSQVGNRSVAIGYNALSSYNTFASIVAIGNNTLANFTGNSPVTAVGNQALENASDCLRCTAVGQETLKENTTGIDNLAIGFQTLESNTTGSRNIGIGNGSLQSNSSGNNNIAIGNFVAYNDLGSNKLFIDNYINYSDYLSNIGNSLIYGEFDNDIIRVNGELQVNNPSTTGYSFPSNDGSANQVLATNGSGNIGFVDPSTLIADEIDWYEASTTTKPNNINDDIYTLGNVAIGKNTANYPLDIQSTTNSILYGFNIDKVDNSANETSAIFVQKTGNGTGRSHGIFTDIEGTGTGQKYGIFNRITSTATGSQYGTRNFISGDSPSFQFGTFNNLDNSGTSNHYGVYNGMRGASAANLYGIYNEFERAYSSPGDIVGVRNRFTNGTPGGDGMNGVWTDFTTAANGTYYGVRNEYSGTATGTGNKYGTYNLISSSAGGTHYGTYNSVSTANGWAGYFLGRIYVGTNSTNGYNLPTTDGSIGQVMTTNGAGVISWSNNTDVTSASNALTEVGNDIRWGGSLTGDTTITYGNFDTRFNLNGTGDFIIQDAGTGKFTVLDNGDSVMGGDQYWRDENTGGTVLAQMLDDGNDARFILRENGSISVDLDTNTQFVFNELGLDRDFRVESVNNINMFRTDATADRVGIGGFPNIDFHVFHGNSGTTSGMRLQNTNNNNWIRMYVSSGTGDLRFYSTNQGTTIISNINDVSGVYTATSDRRLKKGFKNLYFSWDKFMDLQPLTYKYKTDKESKKYIGMVAQDVEKIYPELITYHQEEDVYHMDYSATGVVAIKAIQKLKEEVTELNTEIQNLKSENKALKEKLNKIEQLEARLLAIEKHINHVNTTTVSASADE
ncbi:tail fiber domain-containing protein [Winogradskyella sp.]|uniref:tail fiber domain-containing protein n=1 Tax=Winogradskyella sp. TaxID=1883156 RepID=UPI001B2C4B8B|nr:tail fiber domain-containing protein [Winogradskyella sp.]MBO6879878.1 tail fiber domain-containing protein [Winogradskyella sp.]